MPVTVPALLIYLLLDELPFFKMEMDFLFRQSVSNCSGPSYYGQVLLTDESADKGIDRDSIH